ncbi:hypothetical protein CTEN210_02724 [Chaetoceros tenuissimus]|uniref:F-box domain-containing protein n=1 Tax=Chaetoceros tenuissimus TaxID=426638 RepID=A0AAD3H0V7_9STRA|nr:hypothetical protein CTEN210_02724 [Chaetoceros tenuissimus]
MAVILESARKRARTEKACIRDSSSGNSRVKEILNSLSSLLNEFPELKFIVDFKNLQGSVETAVVKYEEEEEEEKHTAQVLMNYGQETSPLYSLPDEVLSNCLSFVGKGHYGVVALTSKKLNEIYKGEFGNETAYLEMATSINLASHCIDKLCKSSEEKDEILKAAAVNGNLDILRNAVKDGYDLFPLVALKKKTISPDYNSYEYDNYCDSDEEEFDVYYADDNEIQYIGQPQKVKLSKLVERGHLHVLKYLHEELHYFLGLQRYWQPAIEYGKIEILQWLKNIGIMDDGDLRIGFLDNGSLKSDFNYCECAIKSGNVESLKWLQEVGHYDIADCNSKVLADAIKTKSTEMIRYCFNLRYNGLNSYIVESAIRQTANVEVYRLVYELGYEFSNIETWLGFACLMADLEIIKFFRSISAPWDDDIINDIVEYGSLEMIQYAHEDGCPWTNHGEEYYCLLGSRNCDWSLEKLNYLMDNGCIFDYEHSRSFDLISILQAKKELELLDYFIGKNSGFDNRLFKKIFKSSGKPWCEGLSYLLEKGKDVENFPSLEEVFHQRSEIDGIKYFHALGLPWCLDSTRNTHLLSKIACYNDLEDVKWAYENDCKGGNLVPYVKAEWGQFGIRSSALWKTNRAFFEENELLDETFLEKSGIKKIDPNNVQEIGDAQLDSYCDVPRKSSFFRMDFYSLKNLVAHGYKFSSESVQASVCKEAYERCCEYSQNESNRKRLAMFVGMGVRDL